QIGTIHQDTFHPIPSLTELGITVAKPGTGFLDNIEVNSQVNDFTDLRDTFSEHNIKLCNTERRRNFILNNLHFDPVPRYLIRIFNLRGSADVQTNGSVKFKGITTGSRLGVTKHNTDLFTQLVDKYTAAICFRNGTG